MKNTVLVVSLVMLQDFYIDEANLDISPPLDCDKEYLLVYESGIKNTSTLENNW